MKLWRKLKNLVTRSQQNDADIWDAPGGGDGRFFGGSVKEWLEKFGSNSTLQMVARRAAQDVALLKAHLYKQLPGKAGPNGPPREELFDHRLMKLWNQPNPMLVNIQFLYLTQLYLDVGGGEAHWVLERKPGTLEPDAIWPVPKHWVTHRPTAAKPYWEINLNGKSMPTPLPAGEVIWLHDPDPVEPYHKGLGVAKSLDDDIQQDEWMNKFNNQFFRAGGHPGMVLGLEGVERENAKQIKADYEKKYSGFWNAFKTAWIGTGKSGGKVSVHQLSPSHKEMDFVKGKDQKRNTALQAWNMQRFEVGINEDVNRASAQASADGKARNVTLPRSTYLQQAVQCYLVPLYGEPDLIFEMENPVKETEEFRLAKSTEGWITGAITRNEWRRDNGYDPLPPEKGDVLLEPMNMTKEQIGSRREVVLQELRQLDPDAAELLDRSWKRGRIAS